MIRHTIEKIRKGEGGATAVEYAILASLIAAVIVVTVTALGVAVQDLFETVAPPWG